MTEIDTRLRDLNGNLLEVGIDPSRDDVIGADHKPIFKFRDMSDYPDYPEKLKEIEFKWVVPLANHVANHMNITFVDERMYEKMTIELKTRFTFVILNLAKVKFVESKAHWYSVIVMCRRHPLVLVKTVYDLNSNKIGIPHVKLWDGKISKFVVYGDKEQKRFLPRNEVATMIINYLERDKIL